MPPCIRRSGCARAAARVVVAVASLALAPAVSPAQTLAQVANLAALVEYPAFYTDRTVVVRGHLHEVSGRTYLEDDDGHRVLSAWKLPDRPAGTVEATGTLWDVGRMKQDDARLAGYDITAIVGTSGQEWPRPGDVFLLAVTRATPADAASTAVGQAPSIRTLVLAGPRAAGRDVTVVGQFRGRNLFGDLPRSPGSSRWDFVIRSGAAAVWVTGMQPRGKDFDFDPDKRIDSNRWLQVTGKAREDRGLVVIQATRLALTQPGAAQAEDTASQPTPVAPGSPPEVLFSIPTAGQTDVSPATTVRIQLSRAVERASLVDRVRVGYVDPNTGQATDGIASSTSLEERNDAPGGAIAVLVIRFGAPLERLRTVRVELTEGIKSADGQTLKPWTLTFTVGGESRN